MIKKYIHKYKGRNFLICLGYICISLLTTGSSIMLTFSLDALVNMHIKEFIIWNLASFGMWGLLFIINFFLSPFQERTTQQIVSDIRHEIANRIANTPYQNFKGKNEGVYISWLNTDMREIAEKGIEQYFSFINNLILCVVSTIALLTYHYSLVIGTFILMAIMMLVPKLFERKMNNATLMLTQANESFSSELQDTVSGYDEYYNYNIFSKMKNRIRKISKSLADTNVLYARTMAVSQGFIGSTNILCQVLIGIQTGILAYLRIVTIGSTSSTGNIASNIFNSVSQMTSNLFVVRSTDVYFKKYEDFEKNIVDQSESISSCLSFSTSLELKNISYKRNDKIILKNLNLTFSKGNKYALVGESGSGKSTLLNIISGKIDNFSGEILLDGVTQLKGDLKNLRERIIYISQEPYLFNDTLDNNIDLKGDADTYDLSQLIHQLEIDQFLKAEEMIEEHGKNLSGGQKQRIAFARALLSGNEDKLILLDESTANLDKETALKLENRILNDPNLTAIFVTHHLYQENRDKFDSVINLSA